MMRCSSNLAPSSQADPAVATVAMALGAGVGNAAQNNGRMFITLKPRDQRDADASRSSRGCARSSPR